MNFAVPAKIGNKYVKIKDTISLLGVQRTSIRQEVRHR